MKILQVYPLDTPANNSLIILNNHSEKRIKQKTLDFYRSRCTISLKKGGSVIWLISINPRNGLCNGISICAFGLKTKKVIHSLTVVDVEFRKAGLGKQLLDSKMRILRKRYPQISYKSYVNIANEYAIKMCSSIGLTIVGEGSRKREEAKPTKFFIFEDI